VKPHAAAAARAPDVYDDESEFDSAIEISAEHAHELAKELTGRVIDLGPVRRPRSLSWCACMDGVLITTDRARWIIRVEDPSEFVGFLRAMIRPEFGNGIAGSC
jgi:hypothetical protein